MILHSTFRRTHTSGCPHSGYICISLPGERLEALSIPMMVPQNEERHRTAYTVTVDYKHGMYPHLVPFFTCINDKHTCAHLHRNDDRNLGARSRPNSPCTRRTDISTRAHIARFHPPRTHGPLTCATRWRPDAPRTHRNCRRPVCPRRLTACRPALRIGERRRGRQHDATRCVSFFCR